MKYAAAASNNYNNTTSKNIHKYIFLFYTTQQFQIFLERLHWHTKFRDALSGNVSMLK